LKISVIDIGSNTIKLVSYDLSGDNSFTTFQQESNKVRLGEALTHTGELGKSAMERAMDVLLLYRDMIKLESIKDVICIGTSALREAQNSEYFVNQVSRRTGYKIRILSGPEEAYYSYLGAAMSTCLTNAIYFDLGGGSLELVYTEDFKIKKVNSLPLGALRLSDSFAKKDGSFSKKDIEDMIQKIEDTLPSRKNYAIGIDTELVGVGGTCRALVRYHQESANYPFQKVHNYRLSLKDIESIGKKLDSMKPDEISSLHGMDSTRAETIVAGTYVIYAIMTQYNLTEIVVSDFGLREGVLASYIQNPNIIERNNIESLERQISQLISNRCKSKNHYFGLESIIKHLISYGLLKDREAQILSFALYTSLKLPFTNKVNNQFYLTLDEEYPNLTHREQLVLALSILYSKKVKAAESLIDSYGTFLKPQNLKSIQKIGILLKLGYMIAKTRSNAVVRSSEKGRITLDIISTLKSFPAILLEQTLDRVGSTFDLTMEFRLINNNNNNNNNNNSGSKQNHEQNGLITIKSKS
jgi:exopolyphosphatase/guanosine-5'-triphosphate,3'-diphosphate pyrophosphatase